MIRHEYEKEAFFNIIKSSISIADVCRAMNIRPIGGNYRTIRKYISEWNVDISHFTGQAWNKGKTYKPYVKARKLSDILIEDSYYSTSKLRQRLLDEGLKKSECELCKLTEWRGIPISLELHHMNSINTDNRLENLQILCCNCHAQTEQYRGKNKLSAVSERRRVEYLKFKETLTDNADGNLELSLDRNVSESAETLQGRSKNIISEKECPICKILFLDKNKKYCGIDCYNQGRSETVPKVPSLLAAFETHKNFVQVGKFFGVSDNVVRKWVEGYGIMDMIKKKTRPLNNES